LLGVFLLGILVKRSDQSDAPIAFAVTIVSMILIIFRVWHSLGEGWIFILNPPRAEIFERDLISIAWPWYPLVGSAITVSVGAPTSSLRH